MKCLIFLIEARNQARLRDMQAQETLAQFQQRAFDASIERLKAENALKEYMEDSDPPPPPKRCAWSGCGVVIQEHNRHCQMHSNRARNPEPNPR